MLPYLLASVPAPRRGERPEVAVADVAASCRRFLGEPRAREIADALGAGGEPHGPGAGGPPGRVARAWADLSAQVDDAVVRLRCARDDRDPAPYLRRPAGFRVDVVRAVAQAFEAPHPGERERRLDDLRWRLADELAASAPAGFEALYARAVQLRLAWRHAAWDAEAGGRVLEAGLAAIEDAAAGPDVGAWPGVATAAGAADARAHGV